MRFSYPTWTVIIYWYIPDIVSMPLRAGRVLPFTEMRRKVLELLPFIKMAEKHRGDPTYPSKSFLKLSVYISYM